MRLNAVQSVGFEVLELEVTKIAANRMERRRLLAEQIIDSSQDKLFCLAGFTYSQQIAEKAIAAKGKKLFKEMVPKQYRDFAKVFSEEESQHLPQHQPWDHAIDLEPDGVQKWKIKSYPMSPNEQLELDKFLNEHVQKGYLVPSKLPMASPVFFIKKKDGKLQLVQDYWRLNKITIKNWLTKAQYFTKFDIWWGYHNIHIRKGDEWKGAVVTNRGLYEPKVMYFGMTSSPATFQALMNSVFTDLIAKGEVVVYMDDILIYSKHLKDHHQVVREVLKRLEHYDLYLKPEKCEFEKDLMDYPGMIICPGEVQMDPGKVAAVRDWPTPMTLKEVWAFIGFANFYRRFIQGFSTMAHPLHDLTKKDVSWHWSQEQQEAFDTIKKQFCEEPILKVYDPELPTCVECDASGFATGGILSQKHKDGL